MVQRIANEEQLAAALAAPSFLLFKHSDRCSISTRAETEFHAFLKAHPEINAGWIHVIDERPLSLRFAEQSGVTHASPQAVWLKNGRPVWNASHFDITQAALADACS